MSDLVPGNVPDELTESVMDIPLGTPEHGLIGDGEVWHLDLAAAKAIIAAVLPVVRQQIAAEIRARAIEEYAPGTADRALILYWADRVVRGDP